MHLPDVFVLKPIFHEGERMAFAATICHQTDMGGRVAGSNASDSTEIYQEGLRIPPVRMYEAGEPNETLFRLIEKNVRLPVRVFGDLRAQLSACHVAEEAFLRLVERHGPDEVRAYMAELHRLHRAPDPRRPPRAARRPVELRGLDRRRRHRPRPARSRSRSRSPSAATTWSPTGRAPRRRSRAPSTTPYSFTRAATYTCVKSVLPHEILEQRGLLPGHRGDRPARHDRQLRCCPPPAPRAGSPASACSTAASARWP